MSGHNDRLSGVEIASPDDTIQQAASRMAELDVGVLPVGENDRLVGMRAGSVCLDRFSGLIGGVSAGFRPPRSAAAE